MTARCIICSRMHNFRNQRGAKLSERICPCGGKLELVSSAYAFQMGDEWFYPRKNKKGELFLYVAEPIPHYTPLKFKCDMCGEEFSKEPQKVYDENHVIQKGVISCGCHISH